MITNNPLNREIYLTVTFQGKVLRNGVPKLLTKDLDHEYLKEMISLLSKVKFY